MSVRIFIDANVLIAGADSRSGASHAVLIMGEIGLISLVVSRQVLDEAERNLRAKLPRALPTFVEMLTHLNLEVVPDPSLQDAARWESIIERSDARILEAALVAKVSRLLTLNTNDFTPEVAIEADIIIETPGEFVRNVRSIVELGL